jgi:Na+-transporting methylmalonyl-CoA/oxaloacetate decarboxylase beta subunit
MEIALGALGFLVCAVCLTVLIARTRDWFGHGLFKFLLGVGALASLVFMTPSVGEFFLQEEERQVFYLSFALFMILCGGLLSAYAGGLVLAFLAPDKPKA